MELGSMNLSGRPQATQDKNGCLFITSTRSPVILRGVQNRKQESCSRKFGTYINPRYTLTYFVHALPYLESDMMSIK
jgi:hypothetical protein